MLCLAISSHAQVLPDLQNNFAAYQKASLREKLYVHTNKEAYLTGEILWFKLYCTDGSNNKLLDLSKVAYVEVLDSKHNAVLQAKIELKEGTGSGSFYLPFSLANGNYEFRAYTNWMKNFDAAYFFQKQLTIINTIKTSPPPAVNDSTKYNVQFFPAGGHLVNGLQSKVAFKITASDGMGRDGAGVIVNKQNDTIVRFKTLKFGIGSFAFTPTAQSGYRAVIKIGTSVIVRQLPDISASGYVIQTTDHGDRFEVEVRAVEGANDVFLFVHTRNGIKSAQKGTLTDGIARFSISKNKLDEGISYITLFDDHKNPLCERLIFKRPGRKLTINAATDMQVYTTRQKVNLDISTPGQDNKNLAASLSVSVFRVDSFQKAENNHLPGYLWLNADLKGYVESPDYYLDNISNEASQALDNLLLSQGWTQFDWSKISAGEKPHFTFLPEYNGPVVTGNLVNTLMNKPASNITGYLTITGAQHQLYISKSDSAGRLLFNTRNFYGPREIVAQTNWQQDSTYRIDITNPYSEEYDLRTLPTLTLNTGMNDVLTENSLNIQVQNVFYANQLKQFDVTPAEAPMFYGVPAHNYKLDDYTRFPTVEEVIHEYVRLVAVTHHRGKPGFEITNDKKTLTGQPLVMLDSKPIFDAAKVLSIDPLKVKALDVVTNDYIYGPAVLNGILSLTSYEGLSINTELDPRAVVLDYEGLQLARKFYSPVYDTEQQRNSTVPDFRNAIYWNPNADTDQLGSNKLSFYTSDKAGKYIGIIEGITSGGEAGYRCFYFEVKK